MTTEEENKKLKELCSFIYNHQSARWWMKYEINAQFKTLIPALTKQTGTNTLVMESLWPTDDEIGAKVEEYGFRVPYDGSNKFYDDEAIKHFRAGAEWARGFGRNAP